MILYYNSALHNTIALNFVRNTTSSAFNSNWYNLVSMLQCSVLWKSFYILCSLTEMLKKIEKMMRGLGGVRAGGGHWTGGGSDSWPGGSARGSAGGSSCSGGYCARGWYWLSTSVPYNSTGPSMAHRIWKSLISIFQEFSSSIGETFILAGGVGAGVWFYAV